VGSRFCHICGRPVPPAAEEGLREPASYTPKYLADEILRVRSAVEGERKFVAVLFCDIASSTPLAERIGPDQMHALLNRFFELILGEVHRYEGTVNQFLGDGFMALFGAPLAFEITRGARCLRRSRSSRHSKSGEAIRIRHTQASLCVSASTAAR
jgi:class 3 adenylate cyclase